MQFALLQKRTLTILESLVGTLAGDVTTELEAIDAELLSFIDPKSFHGSEGAEASYVRGYERTCIALTQNNIATNPRNLTTLSWLTAVESLREMVKQRTKRNTKK
jgi:hypothetical protein